MDESMCNLFKKIKVFCLAAVFASIAFSQLLAQSNSVNTASSAFSVPITNQLSQFEASVFEIETNRSRTPRESVDRFLATTEQMKGTVNSLENTRNLDRKEMANSWFAIFAVLDKYIDPNFGTLDYFKTNGAALELDPPPDGPGGIRYASGTDPSALKNPEARAEYEAMLKTNWEHMNNTTFQDQLQHVNNQAMRGFGRFIRSSYTSSEADKKELNEMLEQAALSNARKQKLKNLFQ
jgi:hypothetical protein